MTGPGPGPESTPGEAEFNPLRFPPCACARCRGGGGGGGGTGGAAGSRRAGGPGRDPDGEPAAPDADSALLRRLRARVTEENGLRNGLRRVTP
ncbi:hypothetical protein GCM10023082_54370 [Streptomyces tremellae]|uniref:Uncharacterized protein n=1 Tax=Streptomyces tremellae TaxID=1124239 RepID=A0ABP7G0T6_9ACTN